MHIPYNVKTDNYVRHSKMYSGISGPQKNNKDLTNSADTLNKLLMGIFYTKL